MNRLELKELVELTNGYAFKSKSYSDKGHFVMRISNVQNGYIDLNNPKYVEAEKLGVADKFILSQGDILISLTGYIGRVGRIEKKHLPAVLNQRVAKLQIKSKEVLETYLFHFLKSSIFRKELELKGKGTAQQNVSIKDIKSININLPSIEIQKKIVSKLDQAFEAIDQAIANTEKSIENVEELFQSQLANEINQFDNNELVSWNTHVEIRSGRGQKEVEDDNGKYPIVGSAGKTMGYANDYISEENSIIIGRKGTINKPIFMHSKYWNVDTGFGLHALKGLRPEYLFLFCLNYDFTKHDKGSGRPSLVKRDLLKIEMNLPSESEQTQCIERVKALREYHDSLKKSLSWKIKNLEDLKMSILEKAFKGELV